MFCTEPVLHIEEQLTVHMLQCPETNSTSEVSDSVTQECYTFQGKPMQTWKEHTNYTKDRPILAAGYKAMCNSEHSERQVKKKKRM